MPHPVLEIEEQKRPGDEWDAFAEAHPGARLGHAAAWASVLSEAYGLESKYLAARDERGAMRGILPVVAFRSRPGGRRRLISLPYLDGSGILASDNDTATRLLDHALEWVRHRGFEALELRGPAVPGQQERSELPLIDRVNLVLPLESDPDKQWQALRAKVRNQTRKAEREGLRLAEGPVSSLLEGFYEPFRVNMRDLGSPVHAARFFESSAEHFRERLRFIVTLDGARPVGGLVAIRYGRRVTVPWASTLRSERKRCPNNQIYWEAIRWAIETGASEFDFGRSPRDGGTYRFKKGWGAVEEALDWREYDSKGPTPVNLTGPRNPALEKLSRLWTRLPVPLASFVGPRIRRYFSS